MSKHDTLIVGAGMAGIACARALSDDGHRVAVLDKGRGIGGRLATRRTSDGWQFDHGAQYVTARTDGFRDVLADLQAVGAAGPWSQSGQGHVVGLPGMSALVKHLAEGLPVEQGAEVTALAQTAEGWTVQTGTEIHSAARIVITAPAPQAMTLLGPKHALTGRLASVSLLPCVTLMAALQDGPEPFQVYRDPEDPISWIALDSSKPGRSAQGCWVAQAGPDFSAEHIDRSFDEIAALMLPMLCERLGTARSSVVHAQAHRWRYARVAEPLGETFLSDPLGTLYLGGDWCLGPRVEAAWLSGTAIAQAILQDG